MSVRVASAFALMALAVVAPADASRPSAAALYLRARAAEASGDVRSAGEGFAALLAQDPTNMMVASRAYRQALSVGDMALALRAAHQLDARGAAPSDSLILLALEQVKTRDWARARAVADRLGQDRGFGFLAPFFRSWIAFGSGNGDPLLLLEAAKNLPFSSPYYAEQQALMSAALGRSREAKNLADPAATKTRPPIVKDAAHGLSSLLVHVGTDFARQQYTPVGMILGRMAAYAAPDNASASIMTAELLHRMKRPDLGLAALDQISAGDTLSADARSLRIVLLNERGDHEKALQEALVVAGQEAADIDDWGRVGDLYLINSKPAQGAAAYAKAVELAKAKNAPADTLWPILLQQGAALDQAGDWPSARSVLAEAYALAPGNPTVLNQVGYSLIAHREDMPRAGGMIAEASRLRPDDPAITDSLGWSLYLQGRSPEAVPVLERAAAAAPSESEISEHLGDAYWTTGRAFEARYAWRAALVTAEDKDKPRLSAKIEGGLTAQTAAP